MLDQQTTDGEQPAATIDVQAGDDDRSARPSAIWAKALAEGERRLERTPLTAAATALVGGVDVMLGVARRARSRDLERRDVELRPRAAREPRGGTIFVTLARMIQARSEDAAAAQRARA